MKIFKLLAILGVIIVVGGKKNGGRNGGRNNVCPTEIPEGPDCNPDKFQTENGDCEKCHYGRRCCCDDRECYKELTFTCEGGSWNINRDKCPEQKCSMCEMPYDYEKRWVCTEDGCIIDRCLADHLDEDVLTDITLKDKGDESQALCKRAAKKECDQKKGKSQALCERAIKKECDYKKGNGDHKKKHMKEDKREKGDRDHKKKHEQKDNGRND